MQSEAVNGKNLAFSCQKTITRNAERRDFLMFKDKLKSDLDKLSPDNATKSAILQNIQTEAPKKAKILNIKATSVIAACLALVIALGVAVNSDFFSFESVKVDKNSSENKSNYDIIFNAVEKNYEDNKVGLFDNIFNGFGGKEEKYAYSETADTAATGSKGDAYEGEYSKTNTREENVDEEDIVLVNLKRTNSYMSSRSYIPLDLSNYHGLLEVYYCKKKKSLFGKDSLKTINSFRKGYHVDALENGKEQIISLKEFMKK